MLRTEVFRAFTGISFVFLRGTPVSFLELIQTTARVLGYVRVAERLSCIQKKTLLVRNAFKSSMVRTWDLRFGVMILELKRRRKVGGGSKRT